MNDGSSCASVSDRSPETLDRTASRDSTSTGASVSNWVRERSRVPVTTIRLSAAFASSPGCGAVWAKADELAISATSALPVMNFMMPLGLPDWIRRFGSGLATPPFTIVTILVQIDDMGRAEPPPAPAEPERR